MTRVSAATLRVGEPFSGVRPLSAALAEARITAARRDASLSESCLYAVRLDGRVVAYAVTRWTPKRVYFVQARVRLSGGQEHVFIYHANREALDRDGEALIAGAGGPAEVGNVLYSNREVAESVASRDTRQLRRAMAEAHPDRGGTREAFTAARERYLRARQKTS